MSCWSFVYACTVVRKPWSMPNASCSTFAIGATQFVVHDAAETISCRIGSYLSALTPGTSVASIGPFAGAEITTRFAPAFKWAAAVSRT